MQYSFYLKRMPYDAGKTIQGKNTLMALAQGANPLRSVVEFVLPGVRPELDSRAVLE